MNISSGRRRAGLKPAFAFAVLIAALTIASLASVSAARSADAPTITGDPIVGETLVASPPGDSPVYKWQRCDPGTAVSCAGGGKDDPNYVDIPGAEGPTAQSYTLTGDDLDMHIRVLAKDTSLGTQFTPSAPVGPVTTGTPDSGTPSPPAQQGAPKPVHGVQLIGQPTRGVVKYKLPGQKGFTVLQNLEAIPVGTIFNAKKGSVLLTAAKGELGNQTPDNSMEFFGGTFKINQSAKHNSHAVAKLLGKLKCKKGKGGKAGASSAAYSAEAVTSRRRAKRRLWGKGRGRYRTRGRGGTGSVRGTTWLTKDTCKGTFFKVTEGLGIEVDPKKKGKKDVFLGPGEKYFAKL